MWKPFLLVAGQEGSASADIVHWQGGCWERMGACEAFNFLRDFDTRVASEMFSIFFAPRDTSVMGPFLFKVSTLHLHQMHAYLLLAVSIPIAMAKNFHVLFDCW